MPLTPIVGAARLRYFQTGIESTFNTPVAATRRYPWAATPTIDPHWTFPTGDTGTLDQAMAPYGTAQDLTLAISGQQLASNDAPTIISSGVMGGLALTTVSGAAKSLTASPASITQDVFDTYTVQWGDDATNDSWQFTGCVLDNFTLTYPQDLGPIQFGGTWRAAAVTSYPGTYTAGQNVDSNPTWLYAADTDFYVNDNAGSIEINKLSNIAQGAEIAVNNNLDLKRFANGSNTRFAIQNYGRGLRTVTFKLTGAKQTAWLAEASKWIAAAPTERFWGIKTNSTVLAQSPTTFHTFDFRFPGYWLTRADQVIGSNTAFDLNAQNIYDSVLGYPFKVASVSTRSAL
jgi:hypothetical protein